MGCPCEKHDSKPNKCNANTPPVLEVHSEECPVLFHTTNITAEQGTVETLPPTYGAHRNTRVFYEADNVAYLYDSDGVPQLLTVPGPAGGVNSVNGMQGEVTLTAEDVNAQTPLTAGDGINIANDVISATNIINGGAVVPTTSTVGTIGALYTAVDSGTGHLYICTEIDETDPENVSYTWTEITPGA